MDKCRILFANLPLNPLKGTLCINHYFKQLLAKSPFRGLGYEIR
jgi:hypothetical protein